MAEDTRNDMRPLVTEARRIILDVSQKKNLLIDPQGRVLVDVTLRDESGTPRATTVSWDIFSIESLKKAYMKQYGLTDKQMAQLESIRGSIIPLQQEYYFHLSLAARTYTALDPQKFPQEKMAKAHHHTMPRVHKLVIKAFKDAVNKAAKSDGTINEVRLIQELDKARKRISSEAHCFLLEELVNATGTRLSTAELKAMDFKHTAARTTATPNELVHVDQSLGQITLIGGSEVTAHDRGRGRIADRRIRTVSFDETKQHRSRMQIRTPSLDVKEGVSEQEAIADITNKLKKITDKYTILTPFTYNLYTALNDRIGDLGNKQSQGARYILMGAHEYNKKELDSGTEKYCFVQNISVNGFGDTLGYVGNDLKTEATLMAEIAMIYNLTVDPGFGFREDKQIEKLMGKYKDYLLSNNRKPFFSQSDEGRDAKSLIQDIKKKWKRELDNNLLFLDPIENAKTAVKKMMAYDLHFQHEYSKLIQALSVFIEPISIGGCKSGNERAQAINGRVAILDSMAHVIKHPIFTAINALALAEPKEVVAKARALKQKLDVQYDHHLQGAASLISLVDQGASAKVNAKRGIYSIFNRNYAEESTLVHLHQDNAGKMQAHKGLAKLMRDAWKGPKPMSFWGYMKSTSGVIGAIVSIIIIPIALIQSVFYSQYKKEVQAKFQSQLDDFAQKRVTSVPQEPIQSISENIASGIDEKINKIPSWGRSNVRTTTRVPIVTNPCFNAAHQAELKAELKRKKQQVESTTDAVLGTSKPQ